MNRKIKEMSDDIKDRWERRGDIPIWRVFLLAEMAEKGIFPDASFGDDECNIWEAFRRMLKTE